MSAVRLLWPLFAFLVQLATALGFLAVDWSSSTDYAAKSSLGNKIAVLGSLVSLLCCFAGLYWNFSAGKERGTSGVIAMVASGFLAILPGLVLCFYFVAHFFYRGPH